MSNPERDVDDAVRQTVISEINQEAAERSRLEEQHGQVWSTDELTTDFEVRTFLAPCVGVTRRSDGMRGTLFFQHRPRFYWGFEPDSKFK
jgi:hypothetical protein